MNKRVELTEYYRLFNITENAGRFADQFVAAKKKLREKHMHQEKTNKQNFFSIDDKQTTRSLRETLRIHLEQGPLDQDHPHLKMDLLGKFSTPQDKCKVLHHDCNCDAVNCS